MTRWLISLVLFVILEGIYALGDWKVFFGSIFSNDKEASSLIEFWVSTHFEVVKVFEFVICFIVELKEIVNEFCVFFLQFFSILLKIQDCSGFALDLIDVEIVDSSNFERYLCSLNTLALILLLCLRLFLCISHFSLNAESVMSTLFGPELL